LDVARLREYGIEVHARTSGSDSDDSMDSDDRSRIEAAVRAVRSELEDAAMRLHLRARQDTPALSVVNISVRNLIQVQVRSGSARLDEIEHMRQLIQDSGSDVSALLTSLEARADTVRSGMGSGTVRERTVTYTARTLTPEERFSLLVWLRLDIQGLNGPFTAGRVFTHNDTIVIISETSISVILDSVDEARFVLRHWQDQSALERCAEDAEIPNIDEEDEPYVTPTWFLLSMSNESLNGLEVNVRDRMGHTPLFIAAAALYERVVRMLLEHGADPNLESHSGDTALFYVTRDNTDITPDESLRADRIARSLVQRGANVQSLLNRIGNATGDGPYAQHINAWRRRVEALLLPPSPPLPPRQDH
jgi:hypothetical protein